MARSRRKFLLSAAAAALPPSLARSATPPGTPIVNAPVGAVRGKRGNGFNIYTGIPYGSSTTGTARFRAPQPALPWKGVFDATQPPKIAPQRGSAVLPVPGTLSEDCLNLSIWSPDGPGPHPVMAWIHGGGHVGGSTAEPMYNCAVFARAGIVAVAIEFRLGALGYLELGGVLGPEFRGSANNAMRDQLLALQWVQKNIAAFGGDPAKVTVAGESGGGFDVACLLASPLSAGLFSRMIVASGGESVQDIALADSFAQAYVKELGGPARLLAAPFEELVAAQQKVAVNWPHSQPFRQLVMPGILPDPPIKALSLGVSRNVDLIIGTTRDETGAPPPEVPIEKRKTNNINPADLPHRLEAYAKAYPGLSSQDLTVKVMVMEHFTLTSMQIADAHAAAGGKVYRYVIEYTLGSGPRSGTSPHAIDIPMIFQVPDSRYAKSIGFSPEDEAFGKNVVHRVWTSFIRTGVPDANLPAWPLYDSKTRNTMIIDRTSRVSRDYHDVDRIIWADLL